MILLRFRAIGPSDPGTKTVDDRMVKLEGKVVLVTGASRSIGAASARAFAKAGALVGIMMARSRTVWPGRR